MKQLKTGKLYNLKSKGDIDIIKNRCYHIMKKNALDGWTDDFFKYVYEIMLKQPERKSTFDQMGIDFIRHKLGRSGKRGNKKCKKLKENMALGIYSEGSGERIKDKERSIEDVVLDSIIVQKCLAKLKPIDRLILNLHYVQGYTMKELGEMMGRSEALVCIMLKAAIKIAKLSSYK